ncbi:uncharacterized protein CTRU02_206982 [Colletotrichum truncatum]|uniref:Uncharacterized protein n=1 Tax=Colletotrichum truncatum TaxID=5467 RepID=A0ACC3YZP5_COLTU|nr:uncharacterized protein CTRU02_11165 [Colletotrichum truncatum]KAF6786294.1 hypothetical protein CTRU02_11165 [Colletotrichum truncatum]
MIRGYWKLMMMHLRIWRGTRKSYGKLEQSQHGILLSFFSIHRPAIDSWSGHHLMTDSSVRSWYFVYGNFWFFVPIVFDLSFGLGRLGWSIRSIFFVVLQTNIGFEFARD